MEKRKLGKSNILVNPVGLGCMGFSHAYGAPTEKTEAVRMIRKAFDMGYNFFDTAEVYTGVNADGSTSYNEELVGEALRDVRDQVVIATKMGIHFSEQGQLLDSRPETIRKSVEGSLRLLGTDHIDLYYQHRIDPKVKPETVAETMGELIREGKILAWGISETGEEYLRRANAVTPVAAIQNRYSMIGRSYEPLFPTLEELDIALVAFSPLGNGFLSGAYNAASSFDSLDFRSRMPQYTEAGFACVRELMALLARIGEEKQATPAQLSLAWMICKKPLIIPIPGSRKEERLRENLAAQDVRLTAAEIAEIDTMLDRLEIPVYGQRH